MANRLAGAVSPRFKARIAGSSFLIAVAAALIGEFLIGGKLGMGVAFVAVPCYVAVTLLCYAIFRAVNERLSLLAASFNFLGLVFEAVRLNPKGVDIALVFHGLYCFLIGYLILRSIFLPRILALPMTLAGFG